MIIMNDSINATWPEQPSGAKRHPQGANERLMGFCRQLDKKPTGKPSESSVDGIEHELMYIYKKNRHAGYMKCA
jgi:hypothetical protein